MAHYKIFQVCPIQLGEDDYITAVELEDNMADGQYTEFADYIDDELNDDEINGALQFLKRLLSGIFDIDGRVMIFKGADEFVAKWIGEMKWQLEKIIPKESL